MKMRGAFTFAIVPAFVEGGGGWKYQGFVLFMYKNDENNSRRTKQISFQNKLAFKTEYDQETYKKMNLLCRVSLKSSEKQVNAKDIKLENINSNLIPINHQKYVDLFSLCASGIIPRPNHITYLLLPHE